MTYRRLISFVCAASLVIGLCGSVLPAKVKALSSDEIQEQIDELEEQNEQIQAQIEELEQQKQDNFSEMEEVVREKSNIDEQIALLNAQIMVTEEQVSAYAVLISDKQAEYDEAQARFTELNEKNRERIRAMEEDGTIRIGSLTSFSHITKDPIIQKYINVLGEAVDQVGGPQIRNIGTIGGNTCNGVTSADSASTLHALDAIVELTGPDGVRRLPIHEFYIRAGKVDIREGEIQTAILIPKESYENCHGHYIKYAMRNAMDIATLGTSVNVRLSEDKKTVLRARVAFGVAGPVPLRARTAEALAAGQPVSLELAEKFAQAVKEDINPRDSWRAAKDFRMHIAVESAKRAFIESVKLCGGEL